MKTVLKWVAVLVAAGLFIAFWATFVIKADEHAEKSERFEGACQLLGGKVHDDVCVKGDRVVLMRRDVK